MSIRRRRNRSNLGRRADTRRRTASNPNPNSIRLRAESEGAETTQRRRMASARGRRTRTRRRRRRRSAKTARGVGDAPTRRPPTHLRGDRRGKDARRATHAQRMRTRVRSQPDEEETSAQRRRTREETAPPRTKGGRREWDAARVREDARRVDPTSDDTMHDSFTTRGMVVMTPHGGSAIRARVDAGGGGGSGGDGIRGKFFVAATDAKGAPIERELVCSDGRRGDREGAERALYPPPGGPLC